MSENNFSTTITVSQTSNEVFDSINNVSGWWQGEIIGRSEKVNDEFTYQMKEFHFSKQKVIESIPDKKIVWLVTESRLNFLKDKSEWTGTKITFNISEENNKTQLRFTHEGLYEGIECYGACSNGWSKLIHQSLFSLITTGEGKDVF